MSYINVNRIYSYTNPYNSTNAGTIQIPFSPIQQGLNSFALGRGSHAEGERTEAYGLSSHAEGYQTDAFGDYSHSEGIETEALAYGSHAEGYRTEVVSGATGVGWYSHAEGGFTKAFGTYSHAEGSSTEAIANISHAEGKSTTASGIASHAEGGVTTASGNYSHSEGINTVATGQTSHAEGNFSKAYGEGSHAEGYQTQANGRYSHAEGYNTIANADYQHVSGQFNLANSTQAAFIIGNGTDNLNRSNLLLAAGNEMEVFGNTKTETIQITNGATLGYVLTSDASGNGTWQSVAGASDTYVISSTLNGTDLEINRNNGQPQIVVDLSPLSSGDIFTTGATYDNGTATATFNRNDGNSYTLDLSSIDVNDTFVTGSTLNGTNLEINRNNGEPQITVDLSSLSDTTYWTAGSSGTNSIKVTNGGTTDATGNYAVAEGFSTTASGNYSHAEGAFTTAIGIASHAEGNATAIGNYSHAEGGANTSSGTYSHAGGNNSIVSGEASFIHSTDSLLTGNRSVLLGGQNLTGTTDDTVYVPYLNINNLGTGTSVNNLGIDSNGNVITSQSVTLTENTSTDPFISDADVIFYTASLGGGTITLTSSMNVVGKKVDLIRTSTTNTANIDAQSANINGTVGSVALPTTLYSKVTCISDGTDWYCHESTVL